MTSGANYAILLSMDQPVIFPRIQRIDLPRNRSAFLWGPRKTGKTTLLKQTFPDALWIDLLDYELFLLLSRTPKRLRQLVEAQSFKTVVIDEVQKIPHLMDEIHWLIENKGTQFILSGSSARKFKRGNVNLLGGRAWRFELYPLVTQEVPNLDLDRALLWGLLPSHYLSPDPGMDLKAYVFDYLKEEIQAEALTRNLPAFSKFLQSAAISNGNLLNYSNAARDAGVSVKTIRQYYQILQDTLIGRELVAWRKPKKRKLIETSKFFFFDTGVVSALLDAKSLTPGTREYGQAFEHFILQECWAYSHYSRLDFPISYWRTTSGSEVDLILGDAEVAIEVKSSTTARARTRGLHLFQEEQKCRHAFIVSRDPVPRKISPSVTILPWQTFCQMLWAGEILS